jgi:hypothetical protein
MGKYYPEISASIVAEYTWAHTMIWSPEDDIWILPSPGSCTISIQPERSGSYKVRLFSLIQEPLPSLELARMAELGCGGRSPKKVILDRKTSCWKKGNTVSLGNLIKPGKLEALIEGNLDLINISAENNQNT